jgi:hypothetical protein
MAFAGDQQAHGHLCHFFDEVDMRINAANS